MQACKFSCPECSAPLRIKDRTFVGQEMNCPDCGNLMHIVADGFDAVHAHSVTQANAVEPANSLFGFISGFATFRENILVEKSSRMGRVLQALQSPVGIAWSVTAAFGIAMLIAIGPFSAKDKKPGQAVLTAEGNQSDPERSNLNLAAKQEKRSGSDAQSDPFASQAAENSQSPANSTKVVAEIPLDPDDVIPSKGDPELPSRQSDREKTVVVVTTTTKSKLSPVTTDNEKTALSSTIANGQSKSAANEEPSSTKPTEDESKEQVVVETKVESKKIDVKVALSQPILKFQQAEEIPFSHLLFQLEEMLGVPIRYEKGEIPKEVLDSPLAFDLKDTSVGGILRVVLDRVGLIFAIEENEIRLHLKGNADE